MARLKHPNVLPVYDVGTIEHGGVASVFVAMELVEGGTLRQWLATPRARRDILAVFIAAGRGLAAAHAARLVHRDFKPDNVLIDGEGRVYVTDFGIVRSATTSQDRDAPASSAPPSSSSHDSLATPLTRVDSVIGTPGYMAPEQCRGDAVDERTDQFAFCVTLYEALTGARPVQGETYDELIDATIAGRITPAPRHAEVPAWLRRIVQRGLAADPAARWPDLNTLLRALADDPALRRRRLLLGVAGVGAMALVAVGAVRLSAHNQALCRGAERKLAGAWDPGVRAAIARAFAASAVPSAGALATTVSGMLDDYATRWSAMHTEACEATRLRGEQPESVMQLRMSCLDDRMRELRTLTGTLAGADAALVRKSADATAGLSSLQRCADVAALTAPVPPPTDPRTRADVDAVRARLAELKTLEAVGRSQSLVGESEALLASARSLAYAPLVAQTLQVRGDILDDVGEHAAAEPLLFDGFAAAYGAHDDARAADIADDLVTLVGYWLARPADGHHWAALARAAIRRKGGDDELEAWLARDEAWVDYQEGDAARAVADAERALQLGSKAYAGDSPRLAKIRQTLATAYAMAKRYDEAIAEGQRAIAMMTRIYGSDHGNIAAVLTTLGNTENDRGRPADAVGFHARALAILEKSDGPEHPKVAIAHVNLGEAELALKRYGEALPHFRQALAIAQKRLGKEHPVVFHALVGIGTCELELGHAAAALTTLEPALLMAEQKSMSADDRGEARFVLARALWDGGGDRGRARALAEHAAGDAQAAHDQTQAATVAAWLASHHTE